MDYAIAMILCTMLIILVTGAERSLAIRARIQRRLNGKFGA